MIVGAAAAFDTVSGCSVTASDSGCVCNPATVATTRATVVLRLVATTHPPIESTVIPVSSDM